MDTEKLFDTGRRSKAAIGFVVCLVVLVGAVVTASLTQRDLAGSRSPT